MKDLCEALAGNGRNATISKEDDFFGMLIGSWYTNYMNTVTDTVRKGEWHSSRVLEGMAAQDVIVLPHFEYGTALHMYNPATYTWEVAYSYTGRVIRFEAGRQEDKVVLSGLEDEHRKWVFAEITENHFHWQGIIIQQGGGWQVDYDLYTKRMERMLYAAEKKVS